MRFTRIPTVFINKRRLVPARRVEDTTAMKDKSKHVKVMQNAYIQHKISCLDQLESCETLISTQTLQTSDNFYQAKDHLPIIKEPVNKINHRN